MLIKVTEEKENRNRKIIQEIESRGEASILLTLNYPCI